MKVFVFLVSGLLKIDFSMRVFVFLASGIVEDGAVPVFSNEFTMFWRPEIKFQWESLSFWSQAYWKLIFQWKCVFFAVRAIENRFLNESLCFFGLRHCGRRCCALFSFEFVDFLRPEWFFQWESLFFWSQAYWKWIFQWASMFFLVSGLLKVDFSIRVFVSLVSGLLKIDYSMKVFAFVVSGLLKIVFSMRLFLFFVSGLLKIDFSMRACVFFSSGIVEDGAVPFFHLNL